MFRKVTASAVLAALIMVTSGCATMMRQKEEANDLRVRVTEMEKQIQQKDAEIDSLKRSLAKTTEDKILAMRAANETMGTELPSIRDIQTALKNAGYDPGTVDGKMGSATRKAVKAFQKDNGLYVDGKVGKKTWSALEPYLQSRPSAK